VMRGLIRRFLFKYIYQQWNIAIADIGEQFIPKNIKWMKHDYTDRWFADPFIIEETDEYYIVLVEECMRDTQKGRLARLTLSKEDFRLVKNETILDLSTHLSFPNYIDVEGRTYVYPENASSGNTCYYEYGSELHNPKEFSNLPLADAVIFKNADSFYLLYTMGENCNGSRLNVSISKEPLNGYEMFQEVTFNDNIARRAGNVFKWEGRLISPAQVCNQNYGEGVSLQDLTFEHGKINLKEITRMPPPSRDYPKGFHTYNVHGDKVIIDGYRYGSNLLHSIYFSIRKYI